MEEERKYTLIVKKERIAVTEEVYKAYYKHKEREKYLDKLSEEKHISFEVCNQNGIQAEYIFARSKESMEDSIIETEMVRKMMLCLELLDAKDRKLIIDLFFNGKSESEIAVELEITQSGVSRKKTKILKRLRKFMEK